MDRREGDPEHEQKSTVTTTRGRAIRRNALRWVASAALVVIGAQGEAMIAAAQVPSPRHQTRGAGLFSVHD
jgi:hypothetical protein